MMLSPRVSKAIAQARHARNNPPHESPRPSTSPSSRSSNAAGGPLPLQTWLPPWATLAERDPLTNTRLPDPMVLELRRICKDAKVPTTSTDTAATLWAQLLMRAPESLDEVLSQGIKQGRLARAKRSPPASPDWPGRLDVLHDSFDDSTTLKTEAGTMDSATSDSEEGVDSSGAVCASRLSLMDADQFPRPVVNVGANRSLLSPLTRPGDSVVKQMLASAERLDFNYVNVSASARGTAGGDTAKGVQSARRVGLRTSVSSLRTSHGHHEHVLKLTDAKRDALRAEIAALRAADKKLQGDIRNMRWRLTNEKLVDIKESVVLSLISTGSSTRAAFSAERAAKLEKNAFQRQIEEQIAKMDELVTQLRNDREDRINDRAAHEEECDRLLAESGAKVASR